MRLRFKVANDDLLVEIIMRNDFSIDHVSPEELDVLKYVSHLIGEEISNSYAKDLRKSDYIRRNIMTQLR